MLPNNKKWPSIMSFEAPHPLLWHVSTTAAMVCHRSIFFFPSYPKKYRLVLFVVDILSSFLIILISNFFFLNPFDKVLFISIEYFNFNFWYITFFNLILVFLFLISFLGLFVKVLRVFNFIHQFKFMGCYFFFF